MTAGADFGNACMLTVGHKQTEIVAVEADMEEAFLSLFRVPEFFPSQSIGETARLYVILSVHGVSFSLSLIECLDRL
jgi:hypothetical protein